MSIIEELLGGRVTPPPATGPTNPFGPGIMPRHLSIPQVGPTLPLTGTTVPFPTFTPRPTPPPTGVARLSPRLASLGNSARASFSSSPLGRIAGAVGRGGRLTRVGAPLAAGLVASPLGTLVGGQGQDTRGLDRRDAGGFVSGVLTGAALGSFAGPWGAAAGGVIGGVGNALNVFDVFGGGDEGTATTPEDASKALDDTMVELGLGKETRDAIRETTLAQLELATTDAERNAILTNAQAVMQQQALAKEQEVNQLAHSLALQAQAARIFEPYAEANQRNADMAAMLFNNAAQNLPEDQRYLAAQFTLGAQQQSDALTQQLVTTAMAQPRIDALVAQQQQIDSMAAQIVQQAMAGAAGGMMGGGGVDVASLLASAGV